MVDDSILARIGGTPLLRLRRLPRPEMADVFVKCEQLNPGGSVKDRAALAMIEAAEAEGRLRRGRGAVIEATSGNTGVGLALVCAAKGYRLLVAMPEGLSPERQALLRAYGAEVHLSPAAEAMRGAVARAEALATQLPGAFVPLQFRNPHNAEAHRRGTGAEILAQLGGAPDAFVAGVGTGGTLTGVARALREARPDVRVVAVEPAASAVLRGGRPGPHRLSGLGPGFVPALLDRSLISEIHAVSDRDAERTAAALAAREGLLVGLSSGAAMKAALDVAAALGPGHSVVTVLCDRG